MLVCQSLLNKVGLSWHWSSVPSHLVLLLRYFEKPFARIYVIKFQIFWPITLYCNSMKLGLCHIYHIKPSNFWNRKLHVLQGLWKLINCLYVYTFYVVYPNQNLNTLSQKTVANNQHKIDVFVHLTEVAGEGGIDWAPQKFLTSQQFRHLMRCSADSKQMFTYFVHLMRCLNCWDDKNFWGAQSVPTSAATTVKAGVICFIEKIKFSQVIYIYW